MATTESLLGVGKMGDLKRRLLFLFGALIVFRIGAHIPVPGIDPVVLADLFKQQQGGVNSDRNPRVSEDWRAAPSK